ncbi:AbrB/MazE/SpoVT family DNA-binding domain-containing protein [Candidatus Woesearchaeota archaeon]|nr:AbrB/MazE/SpoVT family DNA-binding domain-containing protein [Candidatus Woesearchaeota archaeon]
MESATATITSKNMVVIPKKAREKLHLVEGQKMKVFIGENEIIFSPILSLEDLEGVLHGGKTAKELVTESRKSVSRFD